MKIDPRQTSLLANRITYGFSIVKPYNLPFKFYDGLISCAIDKSNKNNELEFHFPHCVLRCFIDRYGMYVLSIVREGESKEIDCMRFFKNQFPEVFFDYLKICEKYGINNIN